MSNTDWLLVLISGQLFIINIGIWYLVGSQRARNRSGR